MKLLLFLSLAFLSMISYGQLKLSPKAQNPTVIAANQYLTGIDKPKDQATAITLYQQAAQEGDAKAMNALGILYKEGIGTKADRNLAISWLTKAGQLGYAKSWYNLGLIYKDATNEKERDFAKAYDCFSKAADLGDEQSVYAKAYLLYKGLGVAQNYSEAAKLFADGSYKGRPNSMYFFGLCLRNGYGIEANGDSAKFYLEKAAKKGYSQAELELASLTAENSNEQAKALAAKVQQQFMPSKPGSLNQYKRIDTDIQADAIEGKYDGYIIKYDWSGKHAVASSTLHLTIAFQDSVLIGSWNEEGTDAAVPLQASLTLSSILFKNTSYRRVDHYSPQRAVPYDFKEAKLQWIKKGDSVFLAGTIQMFSPDRNEPQKPMYISLVRPSSDSVNKTLIALKNEEGKSINIGKTLVAYPNPFNTILTVDFDLKKGDHVQTQLLTLDGKLVYNNAAGYLSAGHYRLPIKPQPLSAGAYLLRIQCGSESKTIKVIKF